MSTIVIKVMAYKNLPYIFRCSLKCKGACCDTNMLLFRNNAEIGTPMRVETIETLCQLQATMQELFEKWGERALQFQVSA